MFMHKAFVELKNKNADLEGVICSLNRVIERGDKAVEDLKLDIRRIEMDREMDIKRAKLDIEEAKNTIRQEMQKSLIESDLKRVAAESCLATFEKMDTQDERKTIKDMLNKAIEGLSKRAEVIRVVN